MIDNHELQPHMDSVDARLYFCSCKFCFLPSILVRIELLQPPDPRIIIPIAQKTIQERWLHVKHEEQEQMLMDRLCPPRQAKVFLDFFRLCSDSFIMKFYLQRFAKYILFH